MSIFDKLGQAAENAIQGGSITAYALAFAFGVFVSFTPCVYPVIPIIVGYVGNIAGGRKLNAVLYSVVYVVGMAVVYSILGVVVALTGGILGAAFQNFWVLFLLGNLLIALGLWTMGVFYLPVPSFVTGREGSRRGGVVGSFVMGAASAVVVGPCATPAITAMIIAIARSADKGAVGNMIYGATTMFSYALGMGFLLLICGIFSGVLSALPKSGRWLVTVKVVFGLLLILTGELFLVFAVKQAPSSMAQFFSTG